MSLRIIFAGTPAFTLASLSALLHSDHTICAVYTKQDSPVGRGRKVAYSAVKQYLLENNIQVPIFQPASLRNLEVQQQLKELHADLMVVIAYGLILPPEVINIPKFGCINIHASLLPRWRGAAPIQRSILAGDEKTGVTIMQIDQGLDTGDILLKKECDIRPLDTSEDLHQRLAVLGAEALLEVITAIEQRKIFAIPQDDSLSTLAPKITKEEALIDWTKSALEIDRKIRAFNPWPVAYTLLNGEVLRIWQAIVVDEPTNSIPGTVIETNKDFIAVATGSGKLLLLKIQLTGGKILKVSDFLNARKHWFANEVKLGTKCL